LNARGEGFEGQDRLFEIHHQQTRLDALSQSFIERLVALYGLELSLTRERYLLHLGDEEEIFSEQKNG
jgi:hypothetical protein